MLQHVSIEVRPDQVDACLAFWGLLGFEQVTPPGELAERFIWVEREGTQIHLMPFEDPNTTVNGHAAVVVDDYEPTLAALRERGFELRAGSIERLALAIVSLGTGVPITAIAAEQGGVLGIVAAWLGIAGVNFAYSRGRGDD